MWGKALDCGLTETAVVVVWGLGRGSQVDKSSEVHNKRRMTRRTILGGHWACPDRN